MHELGIALEVIDAVVARSNGSRVKRVVLEVGALTAVLPDSLRFCFDLACEGTPLEGASLEIVQPPARARCRGCSNELELVRAFGRCTCGCSELDYLSGDELRIFELEVA